jgi:formamidopyrimidine-DNA glycosylase
MPELPDLQAYVYALEPRVVGRTLERVRIASPFLVRSVDPPVAAVEGKRVRQVRRLGKRIVFAFDDDLFLLLHLMIAGRLHWKNPDAAIPKRNGLAAFDFGRGALLLTEASKKRRAALHAARGTDGLTAFDRAGIEPLQADLDQFRSAVTRENHTLKRALTDPGILSGIGNAYSDEILHAARLSPLARTDSLSDAAVGRLYEATRSTLGTWVDRLVEQTGDGFPEKVTAVRPEMAVHGRYREPCPVCQSPVQRIRYAENECNYCATCQTGGKVLADRALSRLLKGDWPRTIDAWEEKMGQ